MWEADICLAQCGREATRTPIRLVMTGGSYTTDHRHWATDVHGRCSDKYGDKEFDLAAQAALLAKLTARACAEDVLEPRRALRRSWGMTSTARAALNCGKATGTAALTAEVLRVLPTPTSRSTSFHRSRGTRWWWCCSRSLGL